MSNIGRQQHSFLNTIHNMCDKLTSWSEKVATLHTQLSGVETNCATEPILFFSSTALKNAKQVYFVSLYPR